MTPDSPSSPNKLDLSDLGPGPNPVASPAQRTDLSDLGPKQAPVTGASPVPQGSPAPQGMSSPPPSGTPATDQAMGQLNLLSSNPNINMGQYVKNMAVATAPQQAEFWQESGQPIGGPLWRPGDDLNDRQQFIFGKTAASANLIQSNLRGAWNAGAGLSDFVTSPRGLAELGTTMLFPPAGLAFLGAEAYPGAKEFIKRDYQAATGQLSPAESAQAGWETAAIIAPGMHPLAKAIQPFRSAGIVPVSLPKPGAQYPPLDFSREKPGANFKVVDPADATSSTGEVWEAIHPNDLPKDVDQQVATGDIYSVSDEAGNKTYYKRKEGGTADATTEGEKQKGAGEELPRTEAGAAVPEDTEKVRTEQGEPADGGNRPGTTTQVSVTSPYFAVKENGVWFVRSKNDPEGVDAGQFSGDAGEQRAKDYLDYLNKQDADKAAQEREAAAEKTAVGPEIDVEPQPDGSYHVVDRRKPEAPPIFVTRDKAAAQERGDKERKDQIAASGMEEVDLGNGPVLVYDVPTQKAIERMRKAAALRDSGEEIPGTMKDMMESDFKDLTAKGVDMTQFERPQTAPPPVDIKPLKQSPPDTTDTHNTPIEQLIPKEWPQWQQLQKEWGALENDAKLAMGNRDKLQPIVERQIQIKKDQRAIESKLPGGNVQDLVVLGSGNTGLTAAVSASSEGARVTVLEDNKYGGATNETILENIPGTNPFGDKGSDLALNTRQRAMRLGARFEKIRGISGEVGERDPETGLFTIRTLGSGPNGEGGQVIQARNVLTASGVRGKGVPFDIVDSNKQVITERGTTGTPDDESGVKLQNKATAVISEMRAAKAAAKKAGDTSKDAGSSAFIGGANSSVQGALMAAEAGAGPVHLVYRAQFPDASDYLKPAIDDAVARGKLVLHPDEQIISVEKPSEANGFRKVVHTNKTIRDADGTVKKDAEGNPVTKPVSFPVDSVGEFLGGRPASDFLPSEALKSKVKPVGSVITNDQHQVLKQVNVGVTGAKANVPIDGLWAAGTVRFQGQNRLPSAQGEGSDAVVHITKALLDSEKDMPKWKQQLRENVNAPEFGGPPRGAGPVPENAPPGGAEPAVGTTAFWKPSFERTGQKVFINGKWVYVDAQGNPAMVGGKVEKPPPTSVKRKKTYEDLGAPPAPPNQQQDQEAAAVAGGGVFRRGPGLPAEEVETGRPESRSQARPPSEPGTIAEPSAKPDYGPRPADTSGMVERGNIDYNLRPQNYNADGTTARRSVPIQNERGTVLVPTVDDMGRPLSAPQAIARYRDTGEHLGVFNDEGAARDFAAQYDRGPVMSREQAQAGARARTAANPYYPDRLVTELEAGTRARLDPIEEQALVDRREVLANARDQAGKIAMNKDVSPGERASAAADFEKADAGIRQMEHATREGNALNSHANQLKWHQFRARDYDVPAMEQKLSIAKNGEPVTPAETADLTRKVAKLARATANVEREKIRAGWRPGQGKGGDVGQVRQRQGEAFEAKQALDQTVFDQVLKHKNKLQKLARLYRNTAGVSRSIMTADFTSALLRQGGLLFASHPLRSLGMMKDTFRASKSDFEYFRLMQDIRERPNAPLYEQSKLALTDIKNPKMSNLEEAYMSAWVDKIPILNHSQRAYVYFLNRLRADTFDTMAANLGQKGLVTLEQAKGLSNFINVFTGRGRIPEQYAGGIAALNELFFAPRYVLSRFQALTGQPLRYAKDPAVRKAIAWEYGRTLVGYAVIYGLINMLGKQAGVTIEKNPLSTDFGKIKIGNTRIDLLAGIAQTLTVMARYQRVETKTASGQIVSLKQGPNQPFTKRNLPGVLLDFLRSKLAPIPSAVLNAKSGQKVTGEPATWAGEIGGLVLPLNGGDIYRAMVEQGVAPGLALAVLTNFGASVNTYSTHAKTRTRKPHRTR